MVHQTIGGDGITPGTWELNQVKSVNGSTLHLIKPLAHSYVTGGSSKAQVVLAASFGNVEIVNGGTLKPSSPLAADGSMGGIVYVRANKMTVKSGGRIDADGMGFQAVSSQFYSAGSSECGAGTPGSTDQNCSGGAGGKWVCSNAGGGGNKTAGENGQIHAGCADEAAGGLPKGNTNLSTLEFGGAGGSEYVAGGNGGGIIVLGAQSVVVQEGAKISASGAAAAGGGSGGGAGGTIALFSDFHQLDGEVVADGGEGGKGKVWKYIEPTAMGQVSFNTRDHGGGYSPKYREFWYPQWSGSTVYRYDINYQSVGSFGSGSNDIMQLWGDVDGTYYTANWGQDRIRKFQDKSGSQIWERYIGSTAGGVCSDGTYVYGMRHSGATVYKLNKSNGNEIETFSLPGIPNNLHGGILCTPGRLYYGTPDGNVRVYDLNTKAQLSSFNVGTAVYNLSFDGQVMYISPNSSTVTRYKLVEGNTYEPDGAGGDGGAGWVLEKKPMSGIINESYPKGIEIWIDGQEVTSQVGDPNGKGAPGWDAAEQKWGKDGLEAWSTGSLDLTTAANWTLGEHSIAVKETGGAGGDVKMFAYVIYPFSKSSVPANDTCDSPILLDISGPVTTTGTTEDVMGKIKATDANVGPFCGGSGGADVTYAFVLDDWRTLDISVTAAFASKIYVRKGTCADGEVVACGDTSVNTGVLEPGTYYLVVDSDGNLHKGDFTLNVIPSPPDAPDNDSCAAPQQMIFQNNTSQASGMTLFSNDLSSALCGGAGAPENVFTFVVPAGTSKLSLAVDADFAPALYLAKGDCNAAPVACIPDVSYDMGWPGPGNYYLFVDGKTPADKGLFTLTVTVTF
jgi:predicted ribosomally synthesized peptide with SipW-like signal peptide